jgi:hypothetical protein
MLSTIGRPPALLRWLAARSPLLIEVTPPSPPLILNFVVKRRLWYEISVQISVYGMSIYMV